MSLVYWDSMLFVYMLEAHPVNGPLVDKILDSIIRRQDTLCTSAFGAGEVLAGPWRRGSRVEIDTIRQFFTGGSVEVLPFTLGTADRFASIRATNKVSPADAIHLASAAEAGVDIFFTNDGDLRKLSIPGIKLFADLEGKVI
ncbi:MAG: type II toxin-antitoxin system VapC family toxin [Terracidiphilus sp.]